MKKKSIDHAMIKNKSRYECSKCKAICFGSSLDWFSNEPDLTICPVCDNRVEFYEVGDE